MPMIARIVAWWRSLWENPYEIYDRAHAACPHTAPRWGPMGFDAEDADWYCSDCGYGPLEDAGPGGEA